MHARPTDLYAALGVSPAATPAEVSHAFRLLIRRHHPDVRRVDDAVQQAAADAALQEVLAAYEVLRDPQRRADYDRGQGLRSHPINVRRHSELREEPPITVGPVRWHR